MRLLSSTLACLAALFPSLSAAAEFRHETLDDGTEAIFIAGDIERGDEDTFRELTIQFPDAIVALDSNGGALIPALEIGRLIHLRNYMTVVLDDGFCVSSCALIWIAGTPRGLSTTGRLGFHASYVNDGGAIVESGVANALVGRYLSQLNLPEKAVIFATYAPPREVAWLDEVNKSAAGIDFQSFEAEVPSNEAPPPINVAAAPPPIQTIPRKSPTIPTDTEPKFQQGQSAEQIAGILKVVMRQPGFAETSAQGIGARAGLLKPMADHLGELYANDALINRIAYELEASRIDLQAAPDAARSVIFRVTTSLIYKGAQRLPQRDVNRLFDLIARGAGVQDAQCSGLADTGEVNINEFEAIARLGGSSLNDYLSILRKAIIAEVEDYPARINLDEKQISIAENAWADVLVAAVKAKGEEEEIRLTKALAEYDGADRATQCELQKLMLPAVAGMAGVTGDWFRRIYLRYVEDAM